MTPWLSTLLHLLACVAIVTGVWAWYRRTDNAAWIDTAWAGMIGLGALLHPFLSGAVSLRAWGLAVLVVAWSLRLGLHLFHRTAGEPEDGRYAMLREMWAKKHGPQSIPGRFYRFYLAQAFLSVALALPVALVAFDPSTDWGLWQSLALGLGAISLLGSHVSDAQLAAFRARPEHKGRTCREGLWKTSRHPNYFFEILLWVSFALYAVDAHGGLWAWLAPAAITFFLLRVTGIPWTEAQALARRGEDYRNYKRTVSPLIPWFPRKESTP